MTGPGSYQLTANLKTDVLFHLSSIYIYTKVVHGTAVGRFLSYIFIYHNMYQYIIQRCKVVYTPQGAQCAADRASHPAGDAPSWAINASMVVLPAGLGLGCAACATTQPPHAHKQAPRRALGQRCSTLAPKGRVSVLAPHLACGRPSKRWVQRAGHKRLWTLRDAYTHTSLWHGGANREAAHVSPRREYAA